MDGRPRQRRRLADGPTRPIAWVVNGALFVVVIWAGASLIALRHRRLALAVGAAATAYVAAFTVFLAFVSVEHRRGQGGRGGEFAVAREE